MRLGKRHGMGRAALTLLLGGLAIGPTWAGPMLLSPLLPHKVTVATLRPPLPVLPSPIKAPPASPAGQLSPWKPSPGVFSWPLSPSLLQPTAMPWLALRRSDPSLRLSSWLQVLNVARLGVFVVPLRSDPAERTNILLAAQAVDDATVAPGAVFSFNQTVGERTTDKGYQDGLMFSQGQLIRGTGGGICLVATGIYNAALHAGMGLVERHPHSGLVGYAPPGCDASIAYGSEDMQFRNTSDTPVTVKTEIRDDCVVVSLYGQTPPPGWNVAVKTTRLSYIHAPVIQKPDPTLPPDAKPVMVQKPRLGFDVTVERDITQDDQLLSHETVVTEHRAPRPGIVRVPAPPSALPTAPVPTWEPISDDPLSAFGALPTTDGGKAFGPGTSAAVHDPVKAGEDVPRTSDKPFFAPEGGKVAAGDGSASPKAVTPSPAAKPGEGPAAP